jgi:hypothetical protein
MCERAVEQRAALERRLYELPALREAMSERRVSYEQARLIARHADEESVEEWIGRAERLTCVALRRQLLGEREAQMCARGDYEIWAPRHVAELLLSRPREGDGWAALGGEDVGWALARAGAAGLTYRPRSSPAAALEPRGCPLLQVAVPR